MYRPRRNISMKDLLDQQAAAKKSQPHKRALDMGDYLRQSRPYTRSSTSTLPTRGVRSTSIERGPELEQEPEQEHVAQHSQSSNQQESGGPNEPIPIPRKKHRGPTKGCKEWGSGVKLMCRWNKYNQPLGYEGKRLSTQLGVIARNGFMFPLTMTSWECMDKETLDVVWRDIQANTNAPDGYKWDALSKLGDLWRKHKYRVKTSYFNKYDTNEERLANVPDIVEDADQWKTLVSYWSLDEVVKQSEANKQNRENLTAYTRSGRTPHADIYDERERNGEPTDRISIWRATRLNSKGVFTQEDGAADLDAHLENELNSLPNEEREDVVARERIFKNVIGNDGHGRILCMGRLRPSSVRSTAEYDDHVRLEVEKVKKDFEDRERQLKEHYEEELKSTEDRLRASFEDRAAAMEEKMLRLMQKG